MFKNVSPVSMIMDLITFCNSSGKFSFLTFGDMFCADGYACTHLQEFPTVQIFFYGGVYHVTDSRLSIINKDCTFTCETKFNCLLLIVGALYSEHWLSHFVHNMDMSNSGDDARRNIEKWKNGLLAFNSISHI